MPLETATYISDLVTSNPAASDPMSSADDHMRLIKATLKNTLGHTGALTNSDNQLIPAAGTSTKPAYAFASEPALGFYRSAAGVMSIAGRLKGAADVGSIQMFLKEPTSLGKTTTDTGKDYLELNGATYNVADYPQLAAFLGVSSGTFTLPDMYTLGRFPRSRTTTVAALTTQAQAVGSHTHPVTGAPAVGSLTTDVQGSHTHSVSDPGHAHAYTAPFRIGWEANGNGAGLTANTQGSTTAASPTGISINAAGAHSHNVTGSLTAGTLAAASNGGIETRPEAISFVFAVKT